MAANMGCYAYFMAKRKCEGGANLARSPQVSLTSKLTTNYRYLHSHSQHEFLLARPDKYLILDA